MSLYFIIQSMLFKPFKPFKSFAKSFHYAFGGICSLYKDKQQINFKIQTAIGIITFMGGFFFKLAVGEWICIILCCSLVLSLELLNSCIEKMLNVLHPSYAKSIGTVKDMASGSVLMASIGSLMIGGIIFVPKIFKLGQILWNNLNP